ncbi:FG-GAP-like repeat-containing protein [Exilibacterium tricleocarpae]|nr:FG-GAP-like repeat-containing protein [Exilibacterium tricleocarpae]
MTTLGVLASVRAVQANIDLSANLSAPATSDGNYTVSWNNPAGFRYTLIEQDDSGNFQFVYSGHGNSFTFTDKPEGSYTYSLICFEHICPIPEDQVTVLVRATPPGTPGSGPVVGHPDVGAIGGSHSVGNDGSASYQVPIALPPGIAGVQPELALVYNSNGGDGIVGKGWGLSGLSAITVCPTNLHDDGYIATSAVFCLDGQRLVAVSGAYGAPGTEYRTQRESFSQIFSYGDIGGRPEYFVMKTKAGLIMEYGATADARTTGIEAAPVPAYGWSLNEIHDRYSNYARFTYHTDNTAGEHYITDISYTGNANLGVAPIHSVAFVYTERAPVDISRGYFAESKVLNNKLLSEIQLRAHGSMVSRKKLTYSTDSTFGDSGGRSYLSRLDDCLADGTTCLAPTQFTVDPAGLVNFSARTWPVSNVWGGAGYIKVGDFNGDGMDDLASAQSGLMHMKLATGTGFTSATWPVANAWGAAANTWVGDFNGDGLSDIASANRGNVYMKLSTGNGFTSQTWTVPNVWGDTRNIWVGDFNGDGRSDIATYNGSTVYVHLSTGTGFTTQNWGGGGLWGGAGWNFVGDFNGDGMMDIASRYYEKTYVRLSTGTGFTYDRWTLFSNWGSEAYTWVGDFNGDGLSDIASANGGQVFIQISNGRTFLNEAWPVPNNWGDGSGWTWAADFNGDGMTDIASTDQALSPTSIEMKLSTGNGFISKRRTGGREWGGAGGVRLGDFDGDGITDIASIHGGNVYMKRSTAKTTTLSKVTNGFGFETRFTYKRLTDASVYTKDPVSPYPAMSVRNPQYVVSKVETSDGIGGVNSSSYRYTGKKVHLRGMGTLGFRQMTTTNDDTGITSVATFSQDYNERLQGMLLQLTTTAPGSIVTSNTVNTWQTAPFGSGAARRYQTRLNQTTVTKRDLNGAFLHKEVNTYPSYDGYGNLLTTESKLYNASNVLLRTSTTANTYTNDSSNWLIGQLARTRVNTHVVGQLPRAKVSTWLYDGTTGRKTREQIRHPDSDDILHETAYGVDAGGATVVNGFGHNLAVTVSGPDFASRTNSVSYDGRGRLSTQTNAINQASSRTYYTTGSTLDGAYPEKVKTVTDANGIVTLFKYDGFGRVQETISGWGSGTPISTTAAYRYCDSSCPVNAVYYTLEYTQGGTEGRVYLDALGRELRKGVLGLETFNGTPKFVYTDYQYNTLGQNTKVSEPYFEGGTRYWSQLSYDILSRATQTTLADGRVDTVDYNGLTVSSHMDVTGVNQHKVLVKNAMGQVIQSQDSDSNQVDYEHDSHGNMTRVIDPAGNTTVITYDELGRKISMDDPDKGVWSYTYNGLGELITQRNAKGVASCSAYDLLGRLTKRIDNYSGSVSGAVGLPSDATQQCANDTGNPETATWTYDTATGAAKGKLHRVNGKNGFVETHSYDSLGRPIETRKTVNGSTYSVGISYDSFSRPLTTTYPGPSNRLQIKNIYHSSLGTVVQVRNAANNALYFDARQWDARGNLVDEVYGNGVETLRGYENTTGRLTDIRSHTAGSGMLDVQDLKFTFSKVGNLDYREDFRNYFREDFSYDSLNRLTTSQANFDVGGPYNETRTTTVGYNAIGNILSKTGVGNYSYGGTCSGVQAGPHAVTAISGAKSTSYCYDANGNMISGDGRTITYSHFDKPTRITKGSAVTEITYGPDRDRYFRKDTISGKVSEYTYVGGLYEKVQFKDNDTTVNKTEERHFIGGFAVLTLENRTGSSAGVSKTRYLHKDHLGSVTTITDETGSIVEEFSFDAWGKRRAKSRAELEAILGRSWPQLTGFEKNNQTLPALTLVSTITNQGFTGHEQLDAVGLIHMNGRVYDAEIGRFISADPFIDDRTNLQALNRYSYVQNNPLSYTDPSGYFLKPLLSKVAKLVKKTFKAIGNAVQSVIQGVGRMLGKVPWLQAAVGAVLAVYCQWCLPMYFEGMMYLNASITLANGGSVGDALKGMAVAVVSGGITQGIGGGISSALTKAFSVTTELGGQIVSLASSTITSGIAAKASGGKFADGARMGAALAGLSWALSASAPKAGNHSPGEGPEDEYKMAGCEGVPGKCGDVSKSAQKGDGKIDLTEHEGVNGSHTIAKHVGKSDQQLLKRINQSYKVGPIKIGLNEASSFSSLESANNLVSSVLSTNEAEISTFLQSDQNTLVLNKSFGSTTGRVAYRTGGNIFRPGRVNFGTGNSVRVVIRRNDSFSGGFNVHTAFPTRN